jgi:hypothetical protein
MSSGPEAPQFHDSTGFVLRTILRSYVVLQVEVISARMVKNGRFWQYFGTFRPP